MAELFRGWLVRHKSRLRFLKPAWRAWRRARRLVPAAPWLGARTPGRPAGAHARMDEYLAAQAGAGRAVEVYPAEAFDRPPPLTLDGSAPHPVFAALAAARIPAPRVFELHGARYWGHYAGALIGRDDFLLSELSPDVWGVEGHEAFARWSYPECRRLEGTVAIVTTAEADRNYWHWTFDLLPRLHYLARAGFTPANVDWYVVNHAGRPWQLDALRRLGVPPEKIMRADGALHFTAERVVTTSLKPGQFDVARHVAAWLREPFGGRPPAPTRKLYLTRRGAAFRRLRNEAELEPALRAQGYEIVSPETLGLADQIALFAEAKIILGPHGSAFTNAAYAAPAALIAEILPDSYVDAAFWANARAAGQRHAVEFAPGSSGRPYTDVCRQDDLEVAPARFERWLRWVEETAEAR